MFTIKKAMNKNGYVISIGSGQLTYAKNSDELCQCVKHYFRDTPNKCNTETYPFRIQILENE